MRLQDYLDVGADLAAGIPQPVCGRFIERVRHRRLQGR